MQVTYIGPLESVALPDGQVVAPGESATVSAAVGASLLEQDVWSSKSPKADKPETKES